LRSDFSALRRVFSSFASCLSLPTLNILPLLLLGFLFGSKNVASTRNPRGTKARVAQEAQNVKRCQLAPLSPPKRQTRAQKAAAMLAAQQEIDEAEDV
jgi:hypothetical protein